MPTELSNEFIIVAISETAGTIIGVRDRKSGLELIAEPRLAQNFRLHVPVPGHRANYIDGNQQSLSSMVLEDSRAILEWNDLRSQHLDHLDIRVRMLISLAEDSAEVQFELEIDNHSPHLIEEVWLTPLSGTHGLCDRKKTGVYMAAPTPNPIPLQMFDRFQCNVGRYFGTRRPQLWIGYPNVLPMQWLCLSDGENALYFGYHDQSGSTTWFNFELSPGYGEVLSWGQGTWPDPERLQPDQALGLQIAAVKMPFIQPGEYYKTAALVLSFRRGLWHSCAERYRAWCDTWMRFEARPQWLDECDAWWSLQMLTAEDTVYHRFEDIPALARQAREYGVGLLQLIGWNLRGQDRGTPCHAVDPRLGTEEEARAAIDECEAMGVRVNLFSKFIWADTAESWTHNELHGYAVRNPRGEAYVHPGATYETLSSLTQHSSWTWYEMCLNSLQYQEIALREMARIRALGASATQYDQCQAHFRYYCFDSSHDHRYGESLSRGSIELARRFHEESIRENPEFVLSGENVSDVLGQYYAINYCRIWQRDFVPIFAYTFPEIRSTDCNVGFQERNSMHQCILNGHIINYEIGNLKGHLSDAPQMVAYGGQLLAMRRKLADYLWHGRFRDRLGVELEIIRGIAEQVAWSRFDHAEDNSCCVVLVNYGRKPVEAKVLIDGCGAVCSVYRPGKKAEKRDNTSIALAGESIAVLLQET